MKRLLQKFYCPYFLWLHFNKWRRVVTELRLQWAGQLSSTSTRCETQGRCSGRRGGLSFLSHQWLSDRFSLTTGGIRRSDTHVLPSLQKSNCAIHWDFSYSHQQSLTLWGTWLFLGVQSSKLRAMESIRIY